MLARAGWVKSRRIASKGSQLVASRIRVIRFDPNSTQEDPDDLFPAPLLNEDNRDFWTGGRDGELRIVQCDDCGYYIHPPSPRCPRCLSENVEPRPVSGRGRVYTYTVNQRAWSPGLEVPYV